MLIDVKTLVETQQAFNYNVETSLKRYAFHDRESVKNCRVKTF